MTTNNNVIIYTSAADFYEGIYELTKYGVKFVGHHNELKIELLGGY